MRKFQDEKNYSPVLVDIWGDYIDWQKRRTGEAGFLTGLLSGNGCRRVVDASLGDGCDSIYLLKQGYDVTSNELDSVFAQKALENAAKEGVRLKITGYDWREFDERFEPGSFDAVVLQGNSLTHLFKTADQLRALSAFRKVLRPGGVLLIDERNYDYILADREKILKGDFRYSGKYVYCGKKVKGAPIEIGPKKVVLKIAHEDGRTGYIYVYPFKDGELHSLIRKAGFEDVEQYSDFKKGRDTGADYFQYVARK
ncbi:MAG: class I SAM-dependent methyltransferase [Candidatus Micrarchaeia archaeon]